ncbi:Exportin-1 [Apophysomyces sp. BC1021]|nr:Exportin-1 [Apophysomyces sp. BC1021]
MDVNLHLSRLCTNDQVDIGFLDYTLEAYYTDPSKQKEAGIFLTQIQNYIYKWDHVKQILGQSHSFYAKFLSLQILEKIVSEQWNDSDCPKLEIRHFVSSIIIQTCQHKQSAVAAEFCQIYLNKLNLVLVQVHAGINQDQANLRVSEEIFDYSNDQLTVAKVRELKEQMIKEFFPVLDQFRLILQMDHNTEPRLVGLTLAALVSFLSWIPVEYIFENGLVDVLKEKVSLEALRYTPVDCNVSVLSSMLKYAVYFLKTVKNIED